MKIFLYFHEFWSILSLSIYFSKISTDISVKSKYRYISLITDIFINGCDYGCFSIFVFFNLCSFFFGISHLVISIYSWPIFLIPQVARVRKVDCLQNIVSSPCLWNRKHIINLILISKICIYFSFCYLYFWNRICPCVWNFIRNATSLVHLVPVQP